MGKKKQINTVNKIDSKPNNDVKLEIMNAHVENVALKATPNDNELGLNRESFIKDVKEIFENGIDVKLTNSIKSLEDLNILELISLERICSIVCKRYETSARLDVINNNKFKEFKTYYDSIFSEMENRIINICNYGKNV